MKRRILNLDELRHELAAAQTGGATNRRMLDAAGRVLWAVIRHELTSRQYECVTLCMVYGLTLKQAGEKLGINPTTVWRHLQRARKRLEMAVRYAGLASLLEE